jgi:iron complex outermembrane receptor protein
MMQSIITPKNALLLSAVFFTLNAHAQSADTLSKPEVQQLIPVEIRGIRVNDQSPFAVSNLGKKAIREQNLGRDIPYLLDQTPSVTITSDAGAGVGYTGIRIRGTDASRINFTINGIPVTDAESQAAIFVDFPDLLSSTGSIQVQRGVGASTNGAGAFGASVNMSNLEQSVKPFAELDNSFGSFNTLKHTLRAGTGLLKGGFQFDLRLSKISSDGYIERSSSDLKALQFIAGWTSKDKKSALHFNLFTGKEKTGQAWNGVPQDSLATHRRFNGLGLKEDGTYYNDQTDNYQQDYYQLFFDHQFHRGWNLHAGLFLTRGIGFYNEYKTDEPLSDYGRPPFITSSGDTFNTTNLTRRLFLDNYYYGLVYALNYHKKKTSFTLGGAFTKYDGKHYGNVTWAGYGFPADYQWYHLPAGKTGMNLYARLQQQLGFNWFAYADLQYRKVDYSINGFRENPDIDVSVHYNFLNPKIGLSYIKSYSRNAESKAYISFSVAHKEPNRDDFEAAPNDAPSPETLYDWELGYQYKSSKWQAGANLYYMLYHDQLILTGKINDVGAYTRFNVPESYREGLEIMGSWHPLQSLELKANATFSSNKIVNFTEYIDDYDNGGQIENTYKQTDIAFSPDLIASGTATFEPFYKRADKQHFFVDLTGKYVGRQYLDNTTNTARSIDPYGLANVRFRYTVRLHFMKELGVSLALNNVLDKKYSANGYTFSYRDGGQLYTENYYFPQAGFNFLLGVSLSF